MTKQAKGAHWQWEYTDTFGGEANYCWVERGRVRAETEVGAVRRAKAAAGLAGVPCHRESWGDMIALYPRRRCQVLFLSWAEPEPDDEPADDERGPYAIEREQPRSALQ